MRNPEYNQEYADLYNQGKEGIDNEYFAWEHKFKVEDVTDVEILDPSDFMLRGTKLDGEEFCYEIPNMVLINYSINEEQTFTVGVSKSIIEKLDYYNPTKTDRKDFYFYISPNKEVAMVSEGMYLELKDVPIELIKENKRPK